MLLWISVKFCELQLLNILIRGHVSRSQYIAGRLHLWIVKTFNVGRLRASVHVLYTNPWLLHDNTAHSSWFFFFVVGVGGGRPAWRPWTALRNKASRGKMYDLHSAARLRVIGCWTKQACPVRTSAIGDWGGEDARCHLLFVPSG